MKKKIFGIIRATISFGILFYIFRIIPFEEVFLNIYSAKIGYVIIALSILQLNVYVSACKLKILTDKQKMSLSVGKIFKINYITKFYDLFLPQVLSGGVIRWYILSRTDKKPAETLASMVFNRFIEMQILVILGLIFWAMDKPPNSNNIMGMSLLILTIMLFSIHLIIFNKKFADFLLNRLNGITFIPQVLLNKFNKLLLSLGNYHTLSRTALINVLGFTLAKHLFGILSVYLFALSLDISIRFVSIGWIRTILLIICMLPISINGIGLREGSLIFMLGIYGISSTSAVAFSFLLYIGSLLGAVIGGAFIAINLFFPDPKKAEGMEINGSIEKS